MNASVLSHSLQSLDGEDCVIKGIINDRDTLFVLLRHFG